MIGLRVIKKTPDDHQKHSIGSITSILFNEEPSATVLLDYGEIITEKLDQLWVSELSPDSVLIVLI